MKKNMSNPDRIVRLTVAILIGVLYYMHIISGGVAIAGMVVAGIFILTSFVSICPLYLLLGISSKIRESKQ